MASSKTPPQPTKVFDPNGDLLLLMRDWKSMSIAAVSKNKVFQHRFLVSSEALCAVSPVLREVLEGTDTQAVAEQGAKKPKKMRLTSAHANAMEYLLRIVHHQSVDEPKPEGQPDPMEVVHMLEQYEMHSLLRSSQDPWKSLFAKLNSELKGEGKGEDAGLMKPWLYVTYHLKWRNEFQNAVVGFCKEAIDPDNPRNLKVPRYISECIHTTRLKAMGHVLEAVQDILKSTSNARDLLVADTVKKCGIDSIDCREYIPGTLVMHLDNVELRPLPSPPYMDHTYGRVIHEMGGLDSRCKCYSEGVGDVVLDWERDLHGIKAVMNTAIAEAEHIIAEMANEIMVMFDEETTHQWTFVDQSEAQTIDAW